MSKVFWVGIPNGEQTVDKVYVNEVTEEYKKGMKTLKSKNAIRKHLAEEYFKGYVSFFIENAKDAQDAVDTVVNKLIKNNA